MAYITTHLSAPCGYLIVKKDSDPENEEDTVLIQTDYDYPGIASYMGWKPCDCLFASQTDGTVDCPCGRTASEMISSAEDYINNHLDEEFESLDAYFD